MRRIRGALLLLSFPVATGAAACGPAGPARPPAPERVPETCATRLVPRDPAFPLPPRAPLPPFAAPRSTLVVQAEIPLAGVKQALEAKVPRRVAEERDHDLGAAGRLEYTVDRGPFTVRVERSTLVVEAPLLGHAQACAKGRCYAGCAPEARITAKVPLRLGADYRFHSSEVRVDVTKGCEVRALGGLLTIDVTPTLKGALAGQSRNLQAAIDRELPDLRPEATRLWTELGKTRDLPLGMCVGLVPEQITQGPASGTAELASLRFGLLARPEVRVRCSGPIAAQRAQGVAPGLAAPGAPPLPPPLPPLRDDPALPASGDVHLAIVLPDDAAARAVASAGDAIDFGGRRARVSRATGDVSSGLLLDLAGEVCGDARVSASGLAWSDSQSLHLVGVVPMAGEPERLVAASLDPARLAAAIEHAAITLPLSVSALQATLPELAGGMSDDKLTVSATVESAQPESAGLRGADLVAVAFLRGAVTLRAK
jgi:hypothetical protein